MLKVNTVGNINFTAKLIMDDVPILKKGEQNEYHPATAKLVEFDLPREENKVHELCKMPEFHEYGKELYRSLTDTVTNTRSSEKKHCYALVKNNESNLTDIDKNNVLGLCTYYEYEHCLDLIPVFMVNSKYRHSKETPEYKKVGTNMFNAIKEIYPGHSIIGNVLNDSSSFWSRNGFKMVDENTMVYTV